MTLAPEILRKSVKTAISYRYAFNRKEWDSEGMIGGSNTYDYGFSIYNPALGKFLSVDTLASSYPWYSPYQFAGNMSIQAIDLDGLEGPIIRQDVSILVISLKCKILWARSTYQQNSSAE